MPHRILQTPDDLAELTRFLGNLKLPVTVEWVQGRDRTRQQNALQWLWATEIAHQLGDRSAKDVQDQWRLEHGVPILREDSPEFRDLYDRCIKPLPYEMKKVALRHLGIKVTSAMKVRQMVRYMDAVQRECLEFGFITDPDPELAKYQDRYREKGAA
jgi:hypothetical protein